MPIFIPPEVADQPRGDPESLDPRDRLFRYYTPQHAGQTVWKDPNNNWHQQLYPYLGGAVYRTFDNGTLISETFDDLEISIADAQHLFVGGHEYLISDSLSDELQAAGFAKGLRKDSISESFNKSDGSIGPDLLWERRPPFSSINAQVVNNMLDLTVDEPVTHDNLMLMYPNISGPDYTVSITVHQMDLNTGVGLGVRGGLRYSDGSIDSYSAEITHTDVFGAPLWLFFLGKYFKFPGDVPTGSFEPIVLNATTMPVGSLPQLFTYTVSGTSLVAEFNGVQLSANDSTFTDGLISLGIIAKADTGTVTVRADDFQASIL